MNRQQILCTIEALRKEYLTKMNWSNWEGAKRIKEDIEYWEKKLKATFIEEL